MRCAALGVLLGNIGKRLLSSVSKALGGRRVVVREEELDRALEVVVDNLRDLVRLDRRISDSG